MYSVLLSTQFHTLILYLVHMQNISGQLRSYPAMPRLYIQSSEQFFLVPASDIHNTAPLLCQGREEEIAFKRVQVRFIIFFQESVSSTIR